MKNRYKYTEEDIEFLKEKYTLGKWDDIFERFPDLTKSAIHHKMSRINVKFDYSNRNHDYSSDTKNRWTDDEDNIIKDNYSKITLDELCLLMPNRNKKSISQRASLLKVESYSNICTRWKQKEIEYIKNNWELMSDLVIAENLGRTRRSVKSKRNDLKLYRKDMDSVSYPSLAKYLRGKNQKWKLDSMKNCEYKCILTNSKNFEIHHLYGVSNIINDIFKNNKELFKDNFKDYTQCELDYILLLFLEEQSKHPLGVCIEKQLHIKFHSLYGQYYNTQEQFEQFKKDYTNGVYNK